MSMIEDIRKDREAGTPGPWRAGASDFYPGLDGPLTVRVYTDHPVNEFDACGDKSRPNAERIARVPDMEAALLAAEELADAVDEWGAKGRTEATAAALNTALGNYRAATEGKA